MNYLTVWATVVVAIATIALVVATNRTVIQQRRPVCYLRLRDSSKPTPFSSEPTWLKNIQSASRCVYVRIRNVGAGAAVSPSLVLVSD
ncbi:MAG TPA: hypothetical protein VHS78_01280, partial [Candidatus Elarobacter sp.]|nr:hypothetical protein [Candidatus Elarobacter sp.]